MANIELVLTEAQVKLLDEQLRWVNDKGPRDEGWDSPEFADLKIVISNAASSIAD